MSRESVMQMVRETPAYKLGYLRGAVRLAIEMLKHGNIDEAITRLEDSLKIIKGDSNGDTL